MPAHIRLTARFINGLFAGLGLFMCVLTLAEGKETELFVTFLVLAVFGAFNLYVIEKSARLLSEEEWLQAEVRKAELRRQLAEMQRQEAASQQAPSLPGPGG